MPIPEGVPKATVATGLPIITPGGTPARGHLRFTGPDLVTVGPLDLLLGGGETAYLTAGIGSIDLVPNDLDGMNPTGWTYRVDAEFADDMPGWTRYIEVTSGSSTLQLADVLVPDPVAGQFTTLIDPSSLGEAAFLDVGQTAGTVAAGDDDRFGEGGGSTGTPSSTVVTATSFGQSSTAGVATAYSRGDHSHGTPATPTKATVGLGNVDNTSDLGKPLSTATTNALTGKADLVGGTVPTAQLPIPSAQGALTKTSNLSDVSSAATARTNLGLGTAAVAAATAFDAAGAAATAQSAAATYTDGKIAAEVTRANAAYDTAGAASAVAGSLSSHTGATTSVHGIANTSALVTTSDARLTNSRTPSGSASGDLSGTYPGPTVAKVNGVAVSGTPSSGQVLIASSGTAASWQTPSSGGGGGGATPVLYTGMIDAGIVTLTPQADWTPVVGSNGTAVRRIVANVNPGDVLQFSASFLGIGTVYELDARIPKGDGSGAARYLSSDDSTPTVSGAEGYAPWYRQLSFTLVNGTATFVATEDEIDPDGNWTIEQVYRGQSITGTDSRLYWGGGYRGRWDVWHWPFGS